MKHITLLFLPILLLFHCNNDPIEELPYCNLDSIISNIEMIKTSSNCADVPYSNELIFGVGLKFESRFSCDDNCEDDTIIFSVESSHSRGLGGKTTTTQYFHCNVIGTYFVTRLDDMVNVSGPNWEVGDTISFRFHSPKLCRGMTQECQDGIDLEFTEFTLEYITVEEDFECI